MEILGRPILSKMSIFVVILYVYTTMVKKDCIFKAKNSYLTRPYYRQLSTNSEMKNKEINPSFVSPRTISNTANAILIEISY